MTNRALAAYKRPAPPLESGPVAAGAKTQLTGVVGAIAVALLLVFAPNLLKDLPSSALAAVVPPVMRTTCFISIRSCWGNRFVWYRSRWVRA